MAGMTTTSVHETTSRGDAMKAQKFVSYRGWRRRARDFGDDVDARRCDAGLPRVFSVGRWGLAEVYGRTNYDLIIKRE